MVTDWAGGGLLSQKNGTKLAQNFQNLLIFFQFSWLIFEFAFLICYMYFRKIKYKKKK